MSKTTRIFGLDLFRAIAILTVVLAHGKFFLEGTKMEGFPHIKMLDGVELFFVLSGYLIGGILLKDLQKHKSYGLKELYKFWRRRWLRTLPNYYLVLLLNYVVVKYGIIAEDISQFSFKFLIFTQNFARPFYGFFWESWSLSIEEWFYILAPLLLLLMLRLMSLQKAFVVVAVSMIFFSLIYRYSLYDPFMDDFTWDVTIRKLVLTRLDSIGFGLFIAWLHRYFPSVWKKIRIPGLLMGILFIILILNYDTPSSSWYKQTIYYSIISFSLMLLIPFFESIRSRNGVLARIVVHISKISYSMYLINLALVAEVIRDNFYPNQDGYGIMKYILYWTITILASSLLYRFFEKPIMDLRDRRF